MSAYLYGGLGVVILFMGVSIWGQSKHIDALVAEKAALQANFDTAVAANAEQARTIDDLKAANDTWAKQGSLQAKEYKAALEALSRSNAARAKAQEALVAKEAKDRASKECQMVLSEDLSACPTILKDMQDRAK